MICCRSSGSSGAQWTGIARLVSQPVRPSGSINECDQVQGTVMGNVVGLRAH